MFGAGTFGGGTGFGQNNNNQQQQQQPGQGGGLFGNTGGAFGQQQQGQQGGGLFGQPAQPAAGGGLFGQPAQPAQGGGLFGSTNTANTGFGANTTNAFGANANQAPAFGAAPAGGGLFGSTNTAFGQPAAPTTQTNPFGSSTNTNTGGLFGAKPAGTTGGAFGTAGGTGGGGLFGAKPAGTTGTGGLFGGTQGVGAGAGMFGQAQPQIPTNGTVNPAYVPQREKEPTTQNGTTVFCTYHTITHQDAYKMGSLEELRLQDYMAGRKTAPPPGTATAFGAAPTGGIFGQAAQAPGGGLFGQQQPQQTNTGFSFGQNNASTSAFGQNNAAPAFGQASTNTAGGGGLFGSTNNNAAGGGLFGSTNNNTNTAGGGLFGSQNQNQQPAAGGGLFGGGAGNAAGGGGLFGANNNNAAGTGGFGGFGAGNAAKPATGFGFGAGSTTNAFGQPAQQQAGGLFGQNQQNQAAAPAANTGFGMFGQPATQTQGGGLFGNNAQQPAAGGGLFGAAKPATTAFGQPANNTGAGGGLFGGGSTFGQTNTANQAAAPAFGATNNAQAPGQAGGGLFGGFGTSNTNQQPAQNNPFGGGFGAPKPVAPAPGFGGTSLFGSTNQQNNTQQSSGLFANTNANPFGGFSTSQPNQQQNQGAQSGIFGSKPAGGTGLFGAQPAQNTSTTGLFGAPAAQNNIGQSQLGNSFAGFGTNLQQSQTAVPQLDASNPYGYGNSFAVPPSFQPINPPTAPKALPTLSSSFRPAAASPARIAPRFKGLQAPVRSATPVGQGSVLGISTNSNGTQTPQRNLFSSNLDNSLSPAAFSPRNSVKKLVLAKKTDAGTLSASVAGSTPIISRNMLNNPDTDADAESMNGSVAGRSAATNGPAASRQASVARTANGDGNPVGIFPSDSVNLEEYEKGSYWYYPEISTLYNLSPEELKQVDHFCVGRKGYGRLNFLAPVDLSGHEDLQQWLEQTVKIESGFATVYPDESEGVPASPDVGEGLNQPTRVTIENAWPKDKATGRPITHPEHSAVRAYARKIYHKEGVEYVKYNAHTGVWDFKVEHWTQYGDDGEYDDIDGEDQMGSPRNASSPQDQESSPSPNDVDEIASGHGRVNGDEIDDASSVGGSQNQVDGMSHEDEDRFAEQEGETRSDTHGFRQDPPHRMSASMKRKQDFCEAEEGIDGEISRFAADRPSLGASILAAPLKKKAREEWTFRAVESVVKDGEGMFLDVGLMLGRSFRSGISAQGVAFMPSQSNAVITTRLDSRARDSKKSVTPAADIENYLRIQLDHTTFGLKEGVPSAETDGHFRFKRFSDCHRGQKSHIADVWRLGEVLFDEISSGAIPDSSGDVSVDISLLERKTAMSGWLAGRLAAMSGAEAYPKASIPEVVFKYLVEHNVEKAVERAIKGRDLRLATLLAQIGSGEDFKENVRAQMKAWKEQGADKHIVHNYLRLYAVLAGEVGPVDGGADGLDVSAGLTWLQAFGLQFWYGTPAEQPILRAVKNFSNSLESERSPAQPAYPGSSAPDALYALMKVYISDIAPTDCLIDSASYGRLSQDVSVQWHLLHLLVNVLGIGPDSEDVPTSIRTVERLSVEYAAQLEGLGLWTYAVFVMLHLVEEASRSKSIKDVLVRHAEELILGEGQTSRKSRAILESQLELLDRMQVPEAWVAEARAYYYRSTGQIFKEFESYGEAALFDKAHDLFMQHLSSEIIARDDMECLVSFLEPMKTLRVANWYKGGEVLLQYAHLRTETDTLLGTKPFSEDEIPISKRTIDTIPSLIEKLELIYPVNENTTAQQVHARTQMLVKVQSVAAVLADKGKMAFLPPSKLLPENDRLRLLLTASRARLKQRIQALQAEEADGSDSDSDIEDEDEYDEEYEHRGRYEDQVIEIDQDEDEDEGEGDESME